MKNTGRWTVLACVLIVMNVRAADKWQNVTKENQPLLPGNEIQLIKPVEENGGVWIGTLAGAVKIEKGVIVPLKETKGLQVWDITKRPEGGLWIGHGGGALLVDGDKKTAALQGNSVCPIQIVGTRLWAIAKHGSRDVNTVMQAQGDDWVAVPELKGLQVLDIIRDSKGLFWLRIEGNGVVLIDPAKGPAEKQAFLARHNVTSIMTDSKGRTWCGLESGGIMMKEGETWKAHIEKERSAVLSLAESDDGKIWAATSGNGIWVLDGEKWSGMLQDESPISLLKVTADKRIWIGTGKGGLRCWDGKEFKVSLEGPAMKILAELPGGVLFAGSETGGLFILGDFKIKGE